MAAFSSRPRHPVTGRRIRVRAQTQRELDAYLHHFDSLRKSVRYGIRTPEEIGRGLGFLDHGPVTLERAAVAYLERPALAPNTRRGMRSAVDGHFAKLLPLPLAALDGPTVARWVESLEKAGLAAGSIGTLWRKLGAVVRYASERGWISAPPWGDWKPTRGTGAKGRAMREAARSVGELVRLAHAARELDALEYSGLECKILVTSLLGLRQGELAGLRWSDVAWGPPIVVFVTRQWAKAPLKNKRPMRIESIRELAVVLASHREEIRARALYDERGPVFPSPKSLASAPRAYEKGEVLTRLHIRKAVSLAHLPNIRGWSAHSLRDTFVTLEASAAGGDLAHVQARSRHASLASLARYLRTLNRNRPASPALLELPGLDCADDAGFPVPPRLSPPSKETPP
jgi:integrase